MARANNGIRIFVQFTRAYSSGGTKHHKLVIAGGGTGGCAVAARATRKFGENNIAVIDPAEVSVETFGVFCQF